MADTSQFYEYLNSIRTDYSNYVVSSSSDFKKNGFSTMEQKRKLVRLNMFEICLSVMNDFDPTVTSHVFTASEMDDWLQKINGILSDSYYVEFSQYYV